MLVNALRIPGTTKSMYPDDCGLAASEFINALVEGHWERMWFLLSSETRGLCQGAWATSSGRELREVYEIGQNSGHPLFDQMASEFAQGLITDWGQAQLQDLGVLPTRYLDSHRAYVLLVTGAKEPILIDEPTVVPSIWVPMLQEDGHWKAHLPGFAWREQPELVSAEAKLMT